MEWPFDMPNVGDETEYGQVVVKIDDGYSECVDWLESVLAEASKYGVERGCGLEREFLEGLDIEFFVKDYGDPGAGWWGTAFIGVAFSDQESTLKYAKKAIQELKKAKRS